MITLVNKIPVCILTVVLTLVLFGCAGCIGKSARVEGYSIKIGCKAQPVFFVLDGKGSFTEAVDSRSPFFAGWGKNSFTFDGIVAYDNKKTEIKINTDPKTVCKLHGKYYLLSQKYFAKWKFQWFVMEADSVCPIGLNEVPEGLLYIDIDNHELNRLYKIWVLQNNLDDEYKLCVLFRDYILRDPDCLHNRLWGTQIRVRALLGDILNTMCDSQHSLMAQMPVIQMLKASVPEDDPQDITSLCVALYEMNADVFRQEMPRLMARFYGGNVEGDNRLLGLQRAVESISRYEKDRKTTEKR